jgi:hypothetical protein
LGPCRLGLCGHRCGRGRGNQRQPEAAHAGRKVYVIRSATTGGPATRNDDQTDYSIAVLVVERYTDAGDPSREWIDERVDWVHDMIFNPFDFRTPPSWNPFLRTIGGDVLVCDLNKLIAGGKLFWSVVGFSFEEIKTVE